MIKIFRCTIKTLVFIKCDIMHWKPLNKKGWLKDVRPLHRVIIGSLLSKA